MSDAGKEYLREFAVLENARQDVEEYLADVRASVVERLDNELVEERRVLGDFLKLEEAKSVVMMSVAALAVLVPRPLRSVSRACARANVCRTARARSVVMMSVAALAALVPRPLPSVSRACASRPTTAIRRQSAKPATADARWERPPAGQA